MLKIDFLRNGMVDILRFLIEFGRKLKNAADKLEVI